MHLDDLGVTVAIDDALKWLGRNPRRFDVVIDDVYLAGKTDVFRPQHWDEHYLDRLKRAVAPGGLLAANLVTGTGHRTVQSHARRVLKDAFPVVRSVTTPMSMNETLVAGEAVLPGSALVPWTERWTMYGDRRFWGKLRVRKL
jgi:spermidine synthase